MTSTENKIDLTEVNQQIAVFIKERDWVQFHSPKNLSMSIAIEAAELMEHFQWSSSSQEARQVLEDKANRAEIEDELADIAIYLLDFCHLYGIDLQKAIATKMEKNIKKYPAALSKGRSDKYTKYQGGNHGS